MITVQVFRSRPRPLVRAVPTTDAPKDATALLRDLALAVNAAGRNPDPTTYAGPLARALGALGLLPNAHALNRAVK